MGVNNQMEGQRRSVHAGAPAVTLALVNVRPVPRGHESTARPLLRAALHERRRENHTGFALAQTERPRIVTMWSAAKQTRSKHNNSCIVTDCFFKG